MRLTIDLRSAPLAAHPLERGVGEPRPGAEGSEGLFVTDAFRKFFHLERNPLRKWNLPSGVITGGRVLFADLPDPVGRESVRCPD